MTQEEEDNERLEEVKEGKREKDVFREAKRQIKRQSDTKVRLFGLFLKSGGQTQNVSGKNDSCTERHKKRRCHSLKQTSFLFPADSAATRKGCFVIPSSSPSSYSSSFLLSPCSARIPRK